ncbi:MAG TPA: ISL3 family transposase, partial [Lentisphaeria bacterium]|nr:ISL3 family transposase [Lentisphaeria bacterium]
SGAVIHVEEGKGVSALSGILNKLKRSKLKIVTMDMVNAYYSWINQEFPNTKIVFDHFHVIKLINDKLNKVKRKVSAKLNIIKQKAAKGFAL